jgi:FkbM family methyltransferase
MRLPSRRVLLARRLAATLAATPLAAVPWVRGLGERARSRFLRRHPELGGAIAEGTINGVRLLAPGDLLATFVDRRFDVASSARLRAYLRPGMVVVDVGAHVGYYTLLAAERVGRTGRVHALEPGPQNLELLRRNVELFARAPVTVHPVAAGAAEAVRSFHLASTGDASGFYEHPLAATAAVVEVRQVRVDRLVDGPVDLVKVDVEGAELEVLAGLAGLLDAGAAPALLLEWNPACLRAAGRDPAEMFAWLDRNGYRCEGLDEDTGATLPATALLARERAGILPPHWFCNLWAVPRPCAGDREPVQ